MVTALETMLQQVWLSLEKKRDPHLQYLKGI